MTPGVLLAALGGALAAAGIVVTAAGLAGWPAPAPAAPPPRWRQQLRRWRITPRAAAAALAAGLATFAMTGWPVAGLAAVPAVITVPRIVSRKPSRARIAKLEAVESWSRRLADLLAASRGLEDALIHSAGSAAPPIAGPVRDLATRLQARAGSTGDALRAFADDVDDPVGDLIAAALMLAAARRGPGLRNVLNELAEDVAAEVRGRRDVEADRAQHRSTLMWVISFLATYLVVLATKKSYSAPFGTPAGEVVLAVSGGCWAAGLYWLHRLALSSGPQRFLRAEDGGGQGRRPS
jgi:Flp pilus assembly protein TadB